MRQEMQALASYLETNKQEFSSLSDSIWHCAELSYSEFESSRLQQECLERHGFRVTKNVAGLPTAILAEWGDDGPVIAYLGEYDALPGLSQKPGVAEQRSIVEGGPGHGCGHNLLGTGALAAAVAVKEWLVSNAFPGRVRYYGCPAEEASAAKTFMVRDGVFNDIDVAITWHPWTITRVSNEPTLAMTSLDFTFTGKAAHAAMEPHLGRSALDAAELMNIGTNFLREHVTADSRIHYAFLDAGGNAPNVVQAKTTLRYGVRAIELTNMFELVERVKNIARGAALMTDTKVECIINHGVSPLLYNKTLSRVMKGAISTAGSLEYNEVEEAFARELQKTFSVAETTRELLKHGIAPGAGMAICGIPVLDDLTDFSTGLGSTDVGDVSWKAPLVQLYASTMALGTALHSWQAVAQGTSSIAHKGMMYAARIMADTGVALLSGSDLLGEARREHEEMLARSPYRCPIPDDVAPPIKTEANVP